jgi:ribosomal protein L7/L12
MGRASTRAALGMSTHETPGQLRPEVCESSRKAVRRAGELLVSLLDQAGKAEIDDLLARGKFIHAVRRVRELTGLRLIDARRLVDSLQR